MSDVKLFISHASEDAEMAARIVGYLEAKGAPCWLSSRDIPPRSVYAEAITQALRDSSACVVIFSTAANASDAIKRELELASHYRKPFIPIRIDMTEPGPGLDYYLRNIQWIDYRREGERALERIVRTSRPGATPRPSRPPPQMTERKSGGGALVVIGALVLAALGGGYYFTRESTPPEQPQVAEQAPPRPAGPTAEDLRRQQEDAAALTKQRDDALAAAEANRRQLAREQARREAAEFAAAKQDEPPPRPVDRLGRVWNEVEFDGWRGTWTRRGESNTFDGVWRHEGRQDSATLEITVRGDQVSAVRTQRRGQCTYTGVMAANLRSASGAYTCAWDHGPPNAWSATIER
jgi:hypothetical protein